MDATIERRLLINFRLDPVVAQSLLPAPLRPHLVRGSAVAGVCLLRLGDLRPAGFPLRIGWGAENAAHRIAVEWDDVDGTHTGVYVPERHSASWLPVLVGGRVFPGVHKHATFDNNESDGRFRVSLTAPGTSVAVEVVVDDDWRSELFETAADASAFFQAGSVGWSPTRNGKHLEGLRLATTQWATTSARAISVESSFFDALPAGSAELDCVLLMRDVDITWEPPEIAEPRQQRAPEWVS